MSEIQPFVFPDTAQQVRGVLVNDEPWFVAADLCTALELGNPRSSLALLDEDEKGVHAVDTLGGRQQMTVVNEPGLYSLILRSRRPEAKAFKRWVVHDVLPAIRKTGRYEAPVPATPFDELELAERYVESIKARRVLEARNVELEAVTAEMAPKVEAYDAFMEADGTYQMVTVGNMLGIGRTMLFARLREQHILKDDNTPYQRYAHHFKVIGGSHDQNGREVRHVTTRVRPSGVDFLRRRLFPPGTQLTLVS